MGVATPDRTRPPTAGGRRPARRRFDLGKEPDRRFRDLDGKHKRFLLGGIVTLLTTMVLFMYLLPFGYMLATSLKSSDQSQANVLPESAVVHEYAVAEFDLVEIAGPGGETAGFTLLPDGAGPDGAATLRWDGTWDALGERVGSDGVDPGDVALYSASAGRRSGAGVSILYPDADPAVLVSGAGEPEPLAFDGTESALVGALDDAGYTLEQVGLFEMPDPDGDNPALALLRPGAAIDALTDPRLLPTRVDWDGTFAGLAAAVDERLGVDLGQTAVHTVPDAGGTVNGVGFLPPAGEPAVFLDPSISAPEAIDHDGTAEGLAATLDGAFGVTARQLELYDVPRDDGTERRLALLSPGATSSTFVDPDDPTAEPVVWEGRLQTLEPVLEFDPTVENFPDAWNALDFGVRLRNTALIAGIGMAGTVISSTLVAYGLSRFRIPFKGLVLSSLVATIILPRFVTLVPAYMVYEKIGWVGTWWPLILPHFFANAYNVFLLRQFFLTIPRDLDEAAAIDGAGPMKTLVTVILPQAKGAILACALFHFFFAWNDFLEPLLYLVSKPDLQPISIGLYFFLGVYDANIPLIQAGALLGMIVPIIVFLILQKIFLRGIDLSGSVK